MDIKGTTIIGVKKNGQIAIAGDEDWWLASGICCAQRQ